MAIIALGEDDPTPIQPLSSIVTLALSLIPNWILLVWPVRLYPNRYDLEAPLMVWNVPMATDSADVLLTVFPRPMATEFDPAVLFCRPIEVEPPYADEEFRYPMEMAITPLVLLLYPMAIP
jgi:hypothetical protein